MNYGLLGVLVARIGRDNFFLFWRCLLERRIHGLRAKRVEVVVYEVNIIQLFSGNLAHAESGIFGAAFCFCIFSARNTDKKNVTVQLQMTIKMASYILSFFPQERQRPFVFDLAFWLVHLSLSTVCVSCDWLKAEITEWLEYTPAKTFVRFIFQVCFHVARFTCLFHFNIILFTIILSEISWIGELEINAVAKLLLVRSSTDKERPLEISPFDVCGILMAVLKGDILYTEVVFVHERPPGTKCKW